MEEDIFYIFNNEKVYLEEVIKKLFYLQMKSKNLAAFILIILIIDSLFSRKLIITMESVFLLYTLGVIFMLKEKKRAHVKEMTECISRVKKRYGIIDCKTD